MENIDHHSNMDFEHMDHLKQSSGILVSFYQYWTYEWNSQSLNILADRYIEKNYHSKLDKYHHFDMVDLHKDQYLIEK